MPEVVADAHLPRPPRVRRSDRAPSTATFEQVGWVLAGMDRAQPGPVVRDATVTDTDALLREVGLLGRGDRGAARGRSRGVSDMICRPTSRS